MVEGTLSMAGFERQFREHEDVARAVTATGTARPVAANVLMSRLIVLVYRLLRARRRRAASA